LIQIPKKDLVTLSDQIVKSSDQGIDIDLEVDGPDLV
jgi:hypothetical protein